MVFHHCSWWINVTLKSFTPTPKTCFVVTVFTILKTMQWRSCCWETSAVFTQIFLTSVVIYKVHPTQYWWWPLSYITKIGITTHLSCLWVVFVFLLWGWTMLWVCCKPKVRRFASDSLCFGLTSYPWWSHFQKQYQGNTDWAYILKIIIVYEADCMSFVCCEIILWIKGAHRVLILPSVPRY